MSYRHAVGTRAYVFEDLRTLLARATPIRSGDQLAGLAASSAEESVAARMALAAKLLLAVFAGAVAGHWLARHVSEARYRQLVLVILFVAGLYAVLSA